jgi:hypothetical protein
MGQPTPHPPALRLLAAFSRHQAALDWARQRAVAAWGPVLLESPAFDFVETHYYDATMGPGLKKVFFAFRRLLNPAELADIKLETNRWEAEYAVVDAASCRVGENDATRQVCPMTRQDAASTVPRPLNLDPGYLTLGKLVLASTKDFAHRIYLSQGIYAEVTLQYRHRRWQHHEYTFADYRRADYQEFFTACREALKRCSG